MSDTTSTSLLHSRKRTRSPGCEACSDLFPERRYDHTCGHDNLVFVPKRSTSYHPIQPTHHPLPQKPKHAGSSRPQRNEFRRSALFRVTPRSLDAIPRSRLVETLENWREELKEMDQERNKLAVDIQTLEIIAAREQLEKLRKESVEVRRKCEKLSRKREELRKESVMLEREESILHDRSERIDLKRRKLEDGALSTDREFPFLRLGNSQKKRQKTK